MVLSAATLASIRAGVVAAQGIGGQTLWAVLPEISVGGSDWRIWRRGDDTGFGARVETDLGVYGPIYITHSLPITQRNAMPGTPVPDDEWEIHTLALVVSVDDPTDVTVLQVDDRIVSDTDPTLQFRVATFWPRGATYREGRAEDIR